VTFPPGLAKLETNPSSTGSAAAAKTMGIVLLAFLAASIATRELVTMTSTLRRTTSAARSGRVSILPSAYRYSMKMFFPST